MLHFLHCSFPPPPLPRFPFYSSSSVFIVLFCFLNYCLLTEEPPLAVLAFLVPQRGHCTSHPSYCRPFRKAFAEMVSRAFKTVFAHLNTLKTDYFTVKYLLKHCGPPIELGTL